MVGSQQDETAHVEELPATQVEPVEPSRVEESEVEVPVEQARVLKEDHSLMYVRVYMYN